MFDYTNGGCIINVRPLYTTSHMKHISASIIVLAGAIILAGGSHYISGELDFVVAVGSGVCGVGLWGWFASFKEK
jgi:hypothetical protein